MDNQKREALLVKCHLCSKEYEVPCTQAQLEDWNSGTLIQHAMPDVPIDLRELLISGTCGPCFNELFHNDELLPIKALKRIGARNFFLA